MSRLSMAARPLPTTRTDYLILPSRCCPLSFFMKWSYFEDSISLSSMEAVALFSFTASEKDEISFQKGDIIKVSV